MFLLFLCNARRNQRTLIMRMFLSTRVLVKIQMFLKDNNLETDLTYYRISVGILDKNNLKISMIYSITLIAK